MPERSEIERLLRDAGAAINANSGRCALIEEVLCRVTSLCVELLDDLDARQAGAHALAAARSIANYCASRFPTSQPPHPMIDVPWFAEKVQRAIDAALAERGPK